MLALKVSSASFQPYPHAIQWVITGIFYSLLIILLMGLPVENTQFILLSINILSLAKEQGKSHLLCRIPAFK